LYYDSFFFSAAHAQVGINTTTPQSTFEVNGSIGQKPSVSTNTILDDTYNIIVCNNGATL
jgi:hypothetical protein